MQKKYSIWIFAILVSNFVHTSVITNFCTSTPSCDCTLSNDTTLDIACTSTPTLDTLPVLNTPAFQTNVTQLRVISSTIGTNGPLTKLPTNICSSYPNIAILDLSSNSITGPLNTSELACLGSKLIRVDFSNNYINDTDVNFFQANTKLESISLSHNNLVTMPVINSTYFVNFPTSMSSIDFSYNQITNADLWPLFVKTGKTMTIDMSYNQIKNITNQVPIYVKQFTETPDPRSFYLNNNQIERLSDQLLEEYGACATLSATASSYFIVGISNLLLINNSLICDCDSYYLMKFISDHRDDFPQLGNGSALINQAICSAPSAMFGQQYIFSNFSALNACSTYVLPNRTDVFCSVYTNQTSLTLAPPTYWSSSTTVQSSTNSPSATTSNAGGGAGSSQNGANGSSNSAAPSWYIILGIALGFGLIIGLIGLGIFLFRDRLLPEQCRSKLSDSNSSLYRRMNGDPDSAYGDQQPEQETQTCYQIDRTKRSTGVTRKPQPLSRTLVLQSANRSRKSSSSTATDTTTNTKKGAKGIPIASIPSKFSSTLNGNDSSPHTSTSELNMTQIPITASKRAKILPQVKSGSYIDAVNNSLLNTSAGAVVSTQRQRRSSSVWLRRQNQTKMTPPPDRPKSMIAPKTIFIPDDLPNDDVSTIPTIECLSSKSSKPLRALPLLNITVTPAWIDNASDKK